MVCRILLEIQSQDMCFQVKLLSQDTIWLVLDYEVITRLSLTI